MSRQSAPAHLAAVLLAAAIALPAAAQQPRFLSAKPLWPSGRETEMNLSVGFRAVFDAPADAKPVLRVAAASIYRVSLNGQFLGYGPARGPHGYFRIDEYQLAGRVRPGKNLVAVEVAGYNANSYYLLDQPSFLQAELASGDRVLASTAGQGTPMVALVLDYRVQKVARYSFQRPFSEVYRMTPQSDLWRRDPGTGFTPAACSVQAGGKLLVRRVLQPEFAVRRPVAHVAQGRLEPGQSSKKVWKDRSLTQVGPKLKGFPEDELACIPTIELQSVLWKHDTTEKGSSAVQSIHLSGGRYQIVDFGVNRTGFLGLELSCASKARLDLLFDEVLTDGDVDFKRLGCVNVVRYDLEPGQYQLETIEPYTLRYLKLVCHKGDCQVRQTLLREYAHAPVAACFSSSDERLNRLFAAGVETFRQNALDIFMDCPSRERAGWLCDSFFTSRVAADLTGQTLVERNFFENFLLPERFAHLPDGMLPMCYPADHYDGIFIPNWALWFVMQLDEYASRGDREMVDRLRGKVLALLQYFRQFENSDGLLEKLPSWVFVEWSAANRFVQDVNYPSNMLYAGVLSAAARLYNLPDLAAKATALRATILRQSFDGQFFVDNAVRRAGKLQVTRNRTEVCQYFAFYFEVADRQTHAALWRTLRDEFGPDRAGRKAYPEIHAANSFVGNVLRMELLSQAGCRQQILDESIAYLLYMAERTGTLWENVGATASCDHGFASHVVHVLYRDVLGICHIDHLAKKVKISFGDLKLQSCQGTLPTLAGPIDLRWHKEGGRLVYSLRLPAGYQEITEREASASH